MAENIKEFIRSPSQLLDTYQELFYGDIRTEWGMNGTKISAMEEVDPFKSH